MRISDWSSDVCSSDRAQLYGRGAADPARHAGDRHRHPAAAGDDGAGRRPGDIRTTRRGADPAATFVDRDPACRHPTEWGATMKIARGSADEDAPTAGEPTPDSTPSAIPYGFARQFGVVFLDGNPHHDRKSDVVGKKGS